MLQPGDRVLIRNMTPRGGTGKLRIHWEENVHTVVCQVGKDIPFYELKFEQTKVTEKLKNSNRTMKTSIMNTTDMTYRLGRYVISVDIPMPLPEETQTMDLPLHD